MGMVDAERNGSGKASPELLVAESPPEVPASDGSERPPGLTEVLDITRLSVDLCDGPFESYITQRKHIRITKDHDSED